MLKNMKISSKLIFSFLCMIVITVAISLVAVMSMNQMKAAEKKLVEEQVNSLPIISNIQVRVNEIMNITQSFYLYNGDNNKLMTIGLDATAKIADYKQLVTEFEPVINTYDADTQTAFTTANDLFTSSFEQKVLAILEDAKAGKLSTDTTSLSYVEADYTSMVNNYSKCVEACINAIGAENKNNEKVASNATWILFGVLIAGILFAFVLVFFITRSISKPVSVMVKAADSLSRGDLSFNIKHQSKDEIGVLANALRDAMKNLRIYINDISVNLRTMADGDMTASISQEYIGDFKPIKEALITISYKLNKTLSVIDISSDQISVGAEQVASGSQALAQGATEQASSIEQLSDSINDVAEKVRLNADHVSMANESVLAVSKGVEASNEQMQQMLSAMKEINAASDEITKITRVIDDIAFQTSILSINAAIEAAHAGSAGKGFAVVADEVRNLASKSSEAAKQTVQLINKSIAAVSEGTKYANETAKSLAEAATRSKAVEDSIEVIEKSSMEQAHAITWITKSIDQISAVVQNVSATAEESAAASEELSGQSQMLKAEMKKFRLKSADELDKQTAVVSVSQTQPVIETVAVPPLPVAAVIPSEVAEKAVEPEEVPQAVKKSRGANPLQNIGKIFTRKSKKDDKYGLETVELEPVPVKSQDTE